MCQNPAVEPTSPPPPGPPTSTKGTRPWWKKKRFLIPGGLMALIVLLAIVNPPADTEDSDTETAAVAESTTTTAADADVTTTTAEATTTTTEATTTTTTAPQPSGSQQSPLPQGQSATVGEYTVTVVSFDPAATAAVMAENQFNDEPPEGQTYALVRLRVQYQGTDEGNPWVDLTTGYVGSDARAYSDPDCGAVEPDGFSDQPTLFPGGESEANFCLLMPQAVVGTGAIYVEPTFSFSNDDRVWWQG